ncbi:MAG: alpha/beta hydrolase [Aliidongia sp.]
MIERVNAPLILVGHSYGGAVITQAGNEPQVRGLVYVAAFQPDTGETLGSLLHQMPPAANSAIPAGEGYVIVDPKAFHADFAADLPAKEASFMAISEVPISISAFGTPIVNAAWHNKPSWYAVATQDREINPDLERFMAKRAGSTTVEVKGSPRHLHVAARHRRQADREGSPGHEVAVSVGIKSAPRLVRTRRRYAVAGTRPQARAA